MSQADGQPSPEQIREMLNRQRQQDNEQAARQMARHALSQDDDDEGYWEVIGDADISRDDDDTIAPFLATEFSDKFALGNITRREWHSWQWQIENEFAVLANEFRDPESSLDDIDMETMGYGIRPDATDEHVRRIRSAMQVKKLMTSLSINAQGLRSGTEIHAVARTENEDRDEEAGWWSRAKRKII